MRGDSERFRYRHTRARETVNTAVACNRLSEVGACGSVLCVCGAGRRVQPRSSSDPGDRLPIGHNNCSCCPQHVLSSTLRRGTPAASSAEQCVAATRPAHPPAHPPPRRSDLPRPLRPAHRPVGTVAGSVVVGFLLPLESRGAASSSAGGNSRQAADSNESITAVVVATPARPTPIACSDAMAQCAREGFDEPPPLFSLPWPAARHPAA